MKNTLILAFAASLAAMAYAETQTDAENDIPEGPIVNVGGQGRVLFVGANDKDIGLLTDVATNMGRILTIDIGVQRGTWSLAAASKAFAAVGAQAAVFVTDDAALPISLVALEAKWGVVNRHGLGDRQLRTEVSRVALLVLGASSSRYKASALFPTYTPEELAANGGSITIDTVMAVFPTLEKLGIRQYRQLCYRDACYEGLAEPPKTELERKIHKAVNGLAK